MPNRRKEWRPKAKNTFVSSKRILPGSTRPARFRQRISLKWRAGLGWSVGCSPPKEGNGKCHKQAEKQGRVAKDQRLRDHRQCDSWQGQCHRDAQSQQPPKHDSLIL